MRGAHQLFNYRSMREPNEWETHIESTTEHDGDFNESNNGNSNKKSETMFCMAFDTRKTVEHI